MRVTLVCPYAWEDAGGVQVHIRELAAYLRNHEHEVLVLAPTRGPPAEAWVASVGRPVDIRYNDSSAPVDPRPWSRRAVRYALATFGPDVIHAHQPTAPSTGLWATLEARAPVVGTFHSGATRARLYDLAAPLLRRAARRLAIRIAVSERAATFERERIGGDYRIVPNGVDTRRFAAAAPADLGPGRKVLFVGRLDERKGFPVAVAAFGELAAHRPDLHLVVVGDGPDRTALESLPTALRARVTMLGHVPNTELPPIHAACDLYLGPSTGGESFGIVLVEAMAAGLPVVASDTPGYDEVVTDEVDGLLAVPRDPGALAAAAGRVLDDPELAGRLAAAGRERARAFDWATIGARIEDCYREALTIGPPPLR
ncbi:MAG TPA: glycosyltransferase family 4 protein [Actinomycetota bacterium]|nr:glycosyltransferase family 4 protein [Actinomycetota bacterium]